MRELVFPNGSRIQTKECTPEDAELLRGLTNLAAADGYELAGPVHGYIVVCCYCGEPKGGKYECCSENHFEEIELEVEDAEESDTPPIQAG